MTSVVRVVCLARAARNSYDTYESVVHLSYSIYLTYVSYVCLYLSYLSYVCLHLSYALLERGWGSAPAYMEKLRRDEKGKGVRTRTSHFANGVGSGGVVSNPWLAERQIQVGHADRCTSPPFFLKPCFRSGRQPEQG